MTGPSNTQVFGVIGDPIAQSLSPDIHNYWLNKAGIDAYYCKFHLQTNNAIDDIKSLYRLGVKGLNITMPYKDAAIKASHLQTNWAKIIGVANTLTANPDGWEADNTDVLGFYNALVSKLDAQSIVGKKILLIGAGGAARSVAYILNNKGADLTIANRTISTADALIKELAQNGKSVDLVNLSEHMETSDIVVNATSMKAGVFQAVAFPSGKSKFFFDLSYGKAPQTILKIAKNNGWDVEDGLRMLVEQAAISYKIWHGEQPDVEAALKICQQKVG